MKTRTSLLLAALLALPVAACAQDAQSTEQYVAGKHYEVIEPARPTDHPNKVEVIEFFTYYCPHCYAFDPILNDWLKTKPDYVAFMRVPVVFNRLARNYARGWYTAKALGIAEESHTDLFDAIHQKNHRMRSQEELAEFYSDYGVDPDTYLSTAHSFAVETNLSRAGVLSRRYGITGVPTIIVNGQYRVMAGGAVGSWEEVLDVVDYLVQKEHREAKADAGAGSKEQ